MDTLAAIGAASADQATRSLSFDNAELTGEDFLRLMIEELVHQDPLDPIKNDQLLAQVSQMKNMETLSNLDKTLSGMIYQQKKKKRTRNLSVTCQKCWRGQGSRLSGRIEKDCKQPRKAYNER